MSVLVRILVPSTINQNEHITPFAHSERSEKVFTFLSRLNGGATLYTGFGGWVADGKIVGENITIIESFGTVESLSKVKRYCSLLCALWSQDAIGLQVINCDMYFV